MSGTTSSSGPITSPDAIDVALDPSWREQSAWREQLAAFDARGPWRRDPRLRELGARILAFYLVELEDMRLYEETGHSSAAHYAESELRLDRRRTAELIAAGRALPGLPKIDQAFHAGWLTWQQVLLLVQVAMPQHERAWLRRATEVSCSQLALEVGTVRHGAAPRKSGKRKGRRAGRRRGA